VDKDLIEAHVPRRFRISSSPSLTLSLPPLSPYLFPISLSLSLSLSDRFIRMCLCSLSLYIAVVYNGITYPHLPPPTVVDCHDRRPRGLKHIHTVSRWECESLGRSGARAALLLRPRPIYTLVLFVYS